jgi:tetratricopeptide (TPR) repeat protein
MVIVRKNHDAGDAESQIVAANRALELGRYESALEIFQQLAKKNDRDPRILMGLAVAQQKTGLNEQAILTYETLLDIMPDNVDAIINLTGLIQEQYPEVAMRRLTDLSEKYPSNGGIAAQMGMLYAQAGNHAQALSMLGKAASLQPQNAGHLYNMAIVADRMSNKQQAINYYERALEVDAVYGNGRSVPREAIYDRLSKLRQI